MTTREAAPGSTPASPVAAPRAQQELTETLQRSRLGSPFYLLAWILGAMAGDLPQRYPLTFALIALGFIALGAARFQSASLPATPSARELQRRLDRLWAVVLLNSALWGGASFWLLWTTADESARTVAAVSSYAFSTAVAHNFCMRRQRALLGIVLLYVPTMVAYLLTASRYEFVAIGVLYLLYVVLALRRSHREYLQRLDLEDQLRHERDRFEHQSQRDGLTGLVNRRRFAEVLEQWVVEARAAPLAFVLMIFDLDWFKSVNDRHGHAVGDASLRAFAQALQACFSGHGELVARLGGEEFAVLIRDCAVAAALPRADAFRAGLAGRSLPIAGLALGLTVSVGVGGFEPNRHADGDALYNAVDQALYRAKASGRNTVRQAEVAA